MHRILIELKEKSKHNTCLMYLGIGNAFSKNNTSYIIAKNEELILVDIGITVPRLLDDLGIKFSDFDYFHFTHSHSDHIGGLERMLLEYKYIYKRKPKLFMMGRMRETLWDRSLKGGLQFSEEGKLNFRCYADFIGGGDCGSAYLHGYHRDAYSFQIIDGLELRTFTTDHVTDYLSTGLLINNNTLITNDTKFDEQLMDNIPLDEIKLIIHDCQVKGEPSVHATYDQLKTLNYRLKKIMMLSHYGDHAYIIPENNGFKGFIEPFRIYEL